MALTVTLANTGTQNGTGIQLSVALGVTFNPGDLLVAVVACDNGGTSGAVSLSSTSTLSGETVTNRRRNNHDPGNLREGDTLGIWTVTMTRAKTAADVIVFTKVSADYIGVVLWKVSSSTGSVAYSSVGGNVGADAASTSTTTAVTVNIGQVTIGGTAYEGNTTITSDTDTTNGSWSAQTVALANSGTTATSMAVASQYKIQTTANSTQTYNTSFTSASCQAGYVIVVESPNVYVSPASIAATVTMPAVDVLRNAYVTPASIVLLRGGSFNTGGFVGVDDEVGAIAVQPDGKIVVGGMFLNARGVLQNRIARLEVDGSLDTGFNTGGTIGVNSTVYSIALQPDGKIVVGGNFDTARGTTVNYIARLNSDGSCDTGFNTGASIGVSGGNYRVHVVAVQSDGKILVGGDFTTARGTTVNYIARLNSDGSRDTGFNTGGTIGVNNIVTCIAVQSNGKILIGGLFTTARGTLQNYIARLETDGTLDTGFNTGGTVGLSGHADGLAIQSDGKILVAGAVTARGTTVNYIARLETDGSVDTGFNTGVDIGVDSGCVNVVLQPDGKIVIHGLFTNARGVLQNRIARLNSDGTLDTGFNTGGTVGLSNEAGFYFLALALQRDGKIVVGAAFHTARGITQYHITRLGREGQYDGESFPRRVMWY